MRLIDADAFRKELDNYYPFTKEEQSRHGMADIAKSTVLYVLVKQPTVLNPAIKPNRWIPVTERLPETHKAGNSFSGIFMQSKPVLVYGMSEYESEYGFHVVTYCDDLNGITYWSTVDAATINKVTAWMPLPEPYREVSE